MASLINLFSSRPKILTSTPPKEIAPPQDARPDIVKKIAALRGLLTSETAKQFTNRAQFIEYFKDKIIELDLENDYITAYYACQANPESIALFSEEIQRKYLAKTSIFSGLRSTCKTDFDDATTITASLSNRSLRSDDDTLSGRSTRSNSPSGSVRSTGSRISVLEVGDLGRLEAIANSTARSSSSTLSAHPSSSAAKASTETEHAPAAVLVAAKQLPEKTAQENLSTAIVPYKHAQPSIDIKTIQSLLMARSLKVYLASQQLFRHLQKTAPFKATEPQALVPANSVKISQRTNVHPVIASAPKFSVVQPSADPLHDLLQTARLAQEFVLKLIVIESLPTYLRPAAKKLLDNPDAPLYLMIKHVHKLDGKQTHAWAKTVIAQLETYDEIKQLKAITEMKNHFCQAFDKIAELRESARYFINSKQAHAILMRIYHGDITSKEGFLVLEQELYGNIAVNTFVSEFSPSRRKFALSFVQSSDIQNLITDLKRHNASIHQIVSKLKYEFSIQHTIATFVNQFSKETRQEAVILAESRLLEKIAKEAACKGLNFSQTIRALNVFFHLVATKSHYLDQFAEPALTSALKVIKDAATINKILQLIICKMPDARIHAEIDTYIKRQIKEQLRPSMADIFPDLARMFGTRKLPIPKPVEVVQKTLLETLEKKMKEKHAEEVMQAACKALAENSGAPLAMFTTKDLEVLPKPLRDLILAKGFEITDWDEL